MSRMSARFVGQKLGMPAKDVYEMWKDKGVVEKNNLGDWILTALGRLIGGKMSLGNHTSVPTFDFDMISEKMIDFYEKATGR